MQVDAGGSSRVQSQPWLLGCLGLEDNKGFRKGENQKRAPGLGAKLYPPKLC